MKVRIAAVKTFKTRHQFYLPDDLSEKLEALAAEPGSSKTAILTDAFRMWLERRGATVQGRGRASDT